MPTILVTGAGRGLGYELARQYAADGWRVIGTVRKAVPGLKEMGVESLVADVTDLSAVQALARALKSEPIDLLFCNAGIIGKRSMALGSFDYEAAWALSYYLLAERPDALRRAAAAYRDGSYRLQDWPQLAGASLAAVEAGWHTAISRWCGRASAATGPLLW